MKIAFVRHGETDFNKHGKVTGQTDVSLNEEGIRQAEEMTTEVEAVFDVIFSSSAKRALETSAIINKKLRVPIVANALILERAFGSLQGKTWDEIGSEVRKADKEQRYDYRSFGGESAEDVRKRLMDFVAEVKQSGYARPLVVCHGGIIRMLHHLHQKEFGHIENASVHEFDL